MGLYERMFGVGAVAAQGNEARFVQLKQKYQTVLDSLDLEGVRLSSLHVEGENLVIIGSAPSEEAKNRVWDQVKLVDPSFGDLTADITVDPNPDVTPTETYQVKAGDSLWRIAQNKLGDGNRYMEIFYANRDRLDTPQSQIHLGDELKIPAALPGDEPKPPWQ